MLVAAQKGRRSRFGNGIADQAVERRGGRVGAVDAPDAEHVTLPVGHRDDAVGVDGGRAGGGLGDDGFDVGNGQRRLRLRGRKPQAEGERGDRQTSPKKVQGVQAVAMSEQRRNGSSSIPVTLARIMRG